jgi:hypothetical protein
MLNLSGQCDASAGICFLRHDRVRQTPGLFGNNLPVGVCGVSQSDLPSVLFINLYVERQRFWSMNCCAPRPRWVGAPQKHRLGHWFYFGAGHTVPHGAQQRGRAYQPPVYDYCLMSHVFETAAAYRAAISTTSLFRVDGLCRWCVRCPPRLAAG